MKPVGTEPKRLLDGNAESRGEQAAAHLLSNYSAPQLDEVTRKRIWRGVARELPLSGRTQEQPWWRQPIFAVSVPTFALTIGVLMVLWSAPWRRTPAHLEMTAGAVFTSVAANPWTAVRAGATLLEASQLRTDEHGSALMSLSRAGVLVKPGTQLALERLRGDTVLRLHRGEVVAEVEPRHARESFSVQTDGYRIVVEGTVFSVREQAAGDVTVNVSRGQVLIVSGNESWRISAGQSWRSLEPRALGAEAIPAGDLHLLGRAQTEGPRASLRVDGPEGAEVFEGGVSLGLAPITWDAPTGRYHFEGRTQSGPLTGDALANASVATTVVLAPIPSEPPRAVSPIPATTSAAAPSTSSTPIAAMAPIAPIAPVASATSSTSASNNAPTVSRPTGAISHEHERERPSDERRAVRSSDEKIASTSSASKVMAPVPLVEIAPTTSTEAPVPSTSPATSMTPPIPTQPVGSAVSTTATPSQTQNNAQPSTEMPMFVPTPAPAPDPYQSALGLSRAGQYQQAAKAFEAIGRSRGPHADLALYELAMLRREHLGDPEGALAALRNYQQSFPHGSLEQEVQLSTIELLLARSDFVGAHEVMDRFLSDHGDGERAPLVHLLRGNLLRTNGDCQGALHDYDRARGGGVDDDAIFFAASCQQRLGQLDDAADSLRTYLKRFPEGRHRAEVEAALRGQ
jgi:TolA-binding protein